MTAEQKVLEVLEQRTFFVKIGGEDLEMSPLTLGMFDEMGALSSILPALNEKDSDHVNVSEVFSLAGNGKTLAEIFFISAKPNIRLEERWYYTNSIKAKMLEKKRKSVLDRIYNKMTFLEMRAALFSILEKSHVFFYTDCIISLNGMNRLKPTKETEQTVLGS